MNQKHKNLFLIIAVGFALIATNLLYWEILKTAYEIDGYTFSMSDAASRDEEVRENEFIRHAIQGMEIIPVAKELAPIRRAINVLP